MSCNRKFEKISHFAINFTFVCEFAPRFSRFSHAYTKFSVGYTIFENIKREKCIKKTEEILKEKMVNNWKNNQQFLEK